MSGWQCNFSPGWDDGTPMAITHNKPFSEGACRYAYHALYTKYHGTQPHGKKAIVKKLKDFTCWQRQDWDQELKLAEKAKSLVDLWNTTRAIEKRYILYVPEVTQMFKCSISGDFTEGEWISVEPYIEGDYIKWNSNSGAFRDEKLSVHAFCHWTYHQSGGNLLLCDAQGVRNADSYTITDPAICSRVNGQYGMTDCGEPAISQWFRGHKCNEFCNSSWMRHYSSSPAMPVVMASTYTWQTKKWV